MLQLRRQTFDGVALSLTCYRYSVSDVVNSFDLRRVPLWDCVCLCRWCRVAMTHSFVFGNCQPTSLQRSVEIMYMDLDSGSNGTDFQFSPPPPQKDIYLPLANVCQRHLSPFDHIARMPDNVPAKAVLCVACDVRDRVPPFPNWYRSRGRSPITWLHQICSDCGLSAGDALNCAQDQAVWRTYATASSATRWCRRLANAAC